MVVLPSCFIPTTKPNQTPQNNLITSTYQTQLHNTQILLTLTWSRTQFSHTLTLHAPPLFSITLSLSPSSFSFFKSRRGSKSVSAKKIKLHYDFSRAVYNSSAEPDSAYYLAVTCNGKVEFFIGDLRKMELSEGDGLSRLVMRREHVFGRRRYVTKAEFFGDVHEIEIECCGGNMKVKIDGRLGVLVKRLAWKFRGNQRIRVGGIEVEFFWDVLNWVSGSGGGNGVFVFQVGEGGGGVWPEMVGVEKKLMRKSLSASPAKGVVVSPAPSWSSSVWQWAEDSDGGRSSCSNSSARSCGGGGGGFSLVLYAWRRE